VHWIHSPDAAFLRAVARSKGTVPQGDAGKLFPLERQTFSQGSPKALRPQITTGPKSLIFLLTFESLPIYKDTRIRGMRIAPHNVRIEPGLLYRCDPPRYSKEKSREEAKLLREQKGE
jgi:hypothetical protein